MEVLKNLRRCEMRAIQIDVTNEGFEAVREVVIDNYQDYYTLLACECFDVVMVRWRGKAVSIFVDDEGLMKAGNVGRDVEGYPNPLFGNFVICGGVDGSGETLDLDEEFTVLNIMQFMSEIKYIVKGGY
jgi:hypothetical protein